MPTATPPPGISQPGAAVRPLNVLKTISTKPNQIRAFGYEAGLNDTYSIGDILGSGSFGVVRHGVDKNTGEWFAVKSMCKRYQGLYLDPRFVNRVQHEVDVWSRLSGSLNVAHLYDVFEDELSVDLVMELCTGGELYHRIHHCQCTEHQAQHVIRSVLRAVAQAHSRRVVLRDVKPDNFLFLNMNEDSPLKMVDFGLAEYCRPGQRLSTMTGTPIYMAPEVLRQHYSQGVDVWSSGVLAYQLITQHSPWEIAREGGAQEAVPSSPWDSGLFLAIQHQPIDFSSDVWSRWSPGAQEVVAAMLERDQMRRPTAQQLLSHPWLVEQDAGLAMGVDPMGRTLVQRLQRFGTYGRLKRMALRAITPFIVNDDRLVAALRQTFQVLDVDNCGTLTYKDTASVLKRGCSNLSEGEVRQLVGQLDVDDHGRVDYEGWLTAMVDWRAVEESHEWSQWVRRVFETLTQEGGRCLSTKELEGMLCTNNKCVPDTVHAALREAGHCPGTGISSVEFADLLHTSQDDRLELFDSRQLHSPPSCCGGDGWWGSAPNLAPILARQKE